MPVSIRDERESLRACHYFRRGQNATIQNAHQIDTKIEIAFYGASYRQVVYKIFLEMGRGKLTHTVKNREEGKMTIKEGWKL